MPINALRKEHPRASRPAPRAAFDKETASTTPLSEEAQREAELAIQEQEALWDAADNAMTQQEGSLRW